MFFDGLENLVRVLIVGTLAYIGLIFMLRISGNRTLSKMNSFDLVVTVAFGSTLSAVLISKDVTLFQGLVAIALLVALQFVITWLSVRWTAINKIIKTQPTILVQDGKILQEALKTVRVTEEEIHAAARQHGFGGLELIAAVVMETDGSLSIISYDKRGSSSALQGIYDVRQPEKSQEKVRNVF